MFQEKPYRATRALGKDKWSIYAYDDHGQERYLGRVVKQDDYHYLVKAQYQVAAEAKIEGFETAVEFLYKLCKDDGYLTQGHENYLGGRSYAQ